MGKFFSLVKNEYIKTLKKVSTKILILLVIVAAIGGCGIIWAEEALFSSYDVYYADEDQALDYSETLDWLEETKPDDWERQYELYEYFDSLDLYYGKDYDLITMTDIIDEAELTDEQAKEILDPWISDGDWKSTLEAMIPYTESEALKWELEYRVDNDIPYADDWENSVIEEIREAKASLDPELSEEVLQEYEDTITLGLYRLENNISVNPADGEDEEAIYDGEVTIWTALFQMSSLAATVIGLLIMVVAGSCIANEYSQGTIKFLLINPIKRWKILMSKYFTVITFGYVMLALMFLIVLPTAGLMLGFDGISAPYLTVEAGEVVESSAMLRVVGSWLLGSVEFVIYATLAMALSSLTKSAALAVGLSVFFMLAGNTIVLVLNQFGMDWARYLLFANTDLSAVISGTSGFAMHSLSFAICVLVAHFAVFFLTMWDAFDKKEV
ncbi:MAG: ABC transporter permease [Ruminococcus sp.]|nr:ABC transporter permease [Ruminococcus sp.]